MLSFLPRIKYKDYNEEKSKQLPRVGLNPTDERS